MLTNIFSCLRLKEMEILSYATATAADDFWSAIIAVDATLEEGGKYVKSNIDDHTNISEIFAIVA